jgi:LysM repeat protein
VAGDRTQTPTSPTAAPTPPGTYEVADGDTLWDIATRFDTTVEALVEANGLANADELTVGQVLKIATPAPETPAAETPTATATQ